MAVNLIYTTIIVLGYVAAGVHSFGGFCRAIRCSNNLDDWGLLGAFQFTRLGFVIATVMVFTWPLWDTVPWLYKALRRLLG